MTTPNSSLLGGYANELPEALAQLYSANAAATAGSAIGATVSASEAGAGAVHVTTLTLTDTPQIVVNGTEYQNVKIYTFPAGRILMLGATMSLAQKTTSTILSTINGSSTGALAIGTVIASNVALTSTMANIIPSTAFTSSATINVAGTAAAGVLAAAVQFDGRVTPVDVYLNSGYATTGDVDANGTQTFTGTVTMTWQNLDA